MNWPEVPNVRPVFLCFLLLASTSLCIAGGTPAAEVPVIRIEHMMSPSELQQTGILTLSPQQREALNKWLLKYTIGLLTAKETVEQETSIGLQPNVPSIALRSNCDPTIESRISGNFS